MAVAASDAVEVMADYRRLLMDSTACLGQRCCSLTSPINCEYYKSRKQDYNTEQKAKYALLHNALVRTKIES